MRWLIFIFLFSNSILHAQDREYVEIYNSIGQADTLNRNGEKQAAVERYQKAQDALKKLQSEYPRWNENVVKFRLDYIAEKLQSLAPVAAVAPKETVAQNTNASQEVSPAEKKNIETKANEISAQQNPAVSTDVGVLEQKLVAIQKEKNLLQIAIEQRKSASRQKVETSNADLKKLRQLEQDETELKERLSIAGKEKSKTVSIKDDALIKAADQSKKIESQSEATADSSSLKNAEPQVAATKPLKKTKEIPAGAGAMVALAERAFAAQRFDEAEKKYLEVLRQDEKNVYILGNLATTQFKLGHVSDAEKNIGRALAIDPEDSFSLTLLGIIRFEQGKFDEALKVLKHAASLDPQNPETQNYLGITLDQQGQHVLAEAALRNAIRIQPNYAGAHHNLAVIYASQKPPFLNLARWHYEKALALGHPKNPELEKLMLGEK
jgi:Flp pilus assembly protein TadD